MQPEALRTKRSARVRVTERSFTEQPERERATLIMSGEEDQQLPPRSQPWVYMVEEEMLNGHNGDVPPRLGLPMVKEPETSLVQSAVPSGLGEFTLGGP